MSDRAAPVAALDVAGLRRRFPALARTSDDGRPVIFADAPGGSQVPDTVIEAIDRHLRRGISNTHGAFAASEETDATIASARRAAADLTGTDPGEVVFGPNATTLLLHLSRSFGRTLGPGDEVVVTTLDHDANVRPWVLAAQDAGATVRWVDVHDDDVTLDLASFDAALTERTCLVAFTL
ncbi:MAG TPA: aminotransferase class V-fold PLP-dependent enzyme, partial [Actinomycetota bacterium]